LSEIVNLDHLKEQLLKSHWPKCEVLASEIASRNTEDAKRVLIDALKAKRHHIRTAAIKNLLCFNDLSLVSTIIPFLNDSAYETRIEAKKTILLLTGEDILTGRGE
jgi:HEAT repeat protein